MALHGLRPKPVMRRFCTTKTRTGCTTCKRRHVKCDEARPQCRRCVNGRWNCTYEPVRSLEVEVFADAKERRSFDYFRERIATALSGLVGQSFWNGVLFQLVYVQPAVKHAVVSLGALFESLHVRELQHNLSFALELQTYSLRQILLCIKRLQDGDASISAETMLSTCVLMATHQSFLGDWDMSTRHLRSGLKLIEEQGLISKRSRCAPEVLEKCILPELERLKVQCLLVQKNQGKAEDKALIWFGPPPGEFSVPHDFESLQAASMCLDELLQHILDQMHFQSSGEPHDVCEHAKLFHSARGIFYDFEERLRVYLMLHRNSFRSVDQNHQALLNMRMCLSKLFMLTHAVVDETAFDKHTGLFQDLIMWVEEYLRTRPKVGTRLVLVGHDIEPVLALRTTALHCREPSIRAEVVRLLQFADSPELASSMRGHIATLEKIKAIEEKGLDQLDTCNDIPETSRVRLLRRKLWWEPRENGDSHDDAGTAFRVMEYVRWPYDTDETSHDIQREIIQAPCSYSHLLEQVGEGGIGTRENPVTVNVSIVNLPCGCQTRFWPTYPELPFPATMLQRSTVSDSRRQSRTGPSDSAEFAALSSRTIQRTQQRLKGERFKEEQGDP